MAMEDPQNASPHCFSDFFHWLSPPVHLIPDRSASCSFANMPTTLSVQDLPKALPSACSDFLLNTVMAQSITPLNLCSSLTFPMSTTLLHLEHCLLTCIKVFVLSSCISIYLPQKYKHHNYRCIFLFCSWLYSDIFLYFLSYSANRYF